MDGTLTAGNVLGQMPQGLISTSRGVAGKVINRLNASCRRSLKKQRTFSEPKLANSERQHEKRSFEAFLVGDSGC